MTRLLSVLLSAALFMVSCNRHEINVIPYPNHVELKCGSFNMSNARVVCSGQLDSAVLKNVKSFCDVLNTEFTLSESLPERGMTFGLNDALADEAYTIDVNRKSVKVQASGLRGFIYAIQTLTQMLPEIPCCHISDSPRFAYRGLHLDEARHFFGKDEVKKYIDIMAYHKLNTFHWHLTDDQGWRIEIRKYPKLTTVGSKRSGTCIQRRYNTNDGVPYGEGMWYSQDDIKEIVAYAASKGIDVIPEIDLPGHMLAVLAAYPHLGCSGGPYQVWHRWGVSKDVLCVGNEQVYTLIEDILAEVCELFPYKFVHIGGDECPKDSWKTCRKCQAKIRQLGLKGDDEHDAEHYLQSYVMNRVESFLKTKGKSVIGWDEILEGAPSKSATVMCWRGESAGLKAAEFGHDVIMTPTTYCYWDYYQATDVENEPFGIGGYIPVELVYSYDPCPANITDQQRSHILGVQANLWTEYIKTAEHLEYMLLPRLAALSEVQWCMPENKDWNRFLDGMDELCESYEDMGYNSAGHIFGVSGYVEPDAQNGCAKVALAAQGGAPIRYTLDGTDPGMDSEVYEGPIEISSSCVLKASALRNGALTRPLVKQFSFHKAVGKTIKLTHKSQAPYSSKTGEGLLDGIRGPAIHKSKEWCCWTAKPFEAVIDMDSTEPFSSVTIGYLSNKPSQVFNPISLTVSVSDDGTSFTQVATTSAQPEGEFEPDELKSISVSFPETSARYLKVKAECLPNVPSWHHYAGRKANIYFDEVIVD